MMVMRNTIFLGSKKETAFPELSLISPRAGTILCFAQVSANTWVVARRLLYRVWELLGHACQSARLYLNFSD